MDSELTPRRQGDLGEVSAMEWLASQGARIYVPVGHSPDVDLIAELDGALLRIEAKTTTCQSRDRWSVLISTRGGNQSWNGTVKYFDPSRCDYLFVHVGDGRRWMIPSNDLECRSSLTLGGPKYSEFEIEPGRPLFEQPPLESSGPLGECPSGQREHAVNVPAQPSQVRILPPPSAPPARTGRAQTDTLPGYERLAGRTGRAIVWTKRRLTIPIAPFSEAQLSVGDSVRARAAGRGTIVLTRIDTPRASDDIV